MEKAYELEFGGEKSGSLYVNCCGCSKTEPLHSFGPAWKHHYLIHYILNGKGKFMIGGKTYPLEAGYGFLIMPEELAFYQSDEGDPWTYVWVGFSGTKAQEYIKAIGLSVEYPVFVSERSGELYQAVKDMMEHNTYGISNELRRTGQLSIFLSVIAEGGAVRERNQGDWADTYVSKAVEFIQGNYCNPIKVTDVADYVCINRSYLYTLFQNALGMSPQQFLMTFRITKAAELLQHTSLSIESIAISCGYQDPLVFTKAFRQMKKMPPSVYRREMKKGGTRKNREHLEQVEELVTRLKS